MDAERTAVGIATVAWIALAGLAALPYVLFYAGAVGAYYGVGVVGPQWIALLTAVAAFALVAGVERRSHPATAAGIAVTFGTFALVLAIAWAIPAGAVAAGFDVSALFGYHPSAVVVTTAAIEGAAALYARTVLG